MGRDAPAFRKAVCGPANFPAFSCSALLSDDGIPTVPEFVTFPCEVENLELEVASGASPGACIEFLACDSRGSPVDVVPARIEPHVNTVRFRVPVRRVEIGSDNACTLAVGDLRWE